MIDHVSLMTLIFDFKDITQTDDFIGEDCTIGMAIGPLNSVNNEPQILHQAAESFIPASCLKVITCLVATKALGKQFQFKTDLYEIHHQDNREDLMISFGGDPTFSLEDLTALLSPCKGMSFPGYLIVDATHFQTPEWSPLWDDEDKGSDYAAPLSAAIINKNFWTYTLHPTSLGQEALISGLDEIDIDCKVITVGSSDPNIIQVWEKHKLIISGTIPIDGGAIVWQISSQTSHYYLNMHIEAIISQLGIQCEKGVKFIYDRNEVSINRKLIGVHVSEPLEVFMPPAMKQSDNVIFDSLYLTLLHQYGPHLPKWEEGDRIMKILTLEHLNINLDSCTMVDGSGLSRKNSFQPFLLWKILQMAYEDAFFLTCLAQPLEKETSLENRGELPTCVFAKTGGMTGITCLSGYLMIIPNPIAFVLFLSHPTDALEAAKVLQASLLKGAMEANFDLERDKYL